MKKLIGAILAILSVMATSVPALAEQVGTSVTIQPGTGNPPVVITKWEGPDDGDIWYPNYTDPSGLPGNFACQPGTQVRPPLEWQAYKDVYYFAIADDPQGDTSINTVYVDVFHPQGSPAPYNENNYFKYQLAMQRVPWGATMSSVYSGLEEMTARAFFIRAWDKGLIDQDCVGVNLRTASPSDDGPYTKAEILELIDQQSIGFFAVKGDLYYEQPAGDYRVIIKAVDNQNNQGTLSNNLYYVPVSMVEFDFNSFSFGQVFPNSRQDIDGNRSWANPAPAAAGRDGQGYELNGATVRNIGNVWSKVTVSESDLFQNDLPLGKTGTEWNVVYWARMGDPDLGGTNSLMFYPGQMVTLPDTLELSTVDKLDFSIRIRKMGINGTWTGTMMLGSVPTEFPWPIEAN